jgi:hypothetical protein
MSHASADSIQFKLPLCALQMCSVFLFGLESTPGLRFIVAQVTETAMAPFCDENCNRK